MERELNLRLILEILDKHHVLYILIGGLAAVTHGSPFPTTDVDITPDRSRDNMERLSQALTELDARIRVEGVPEGLPFNHDGDSLLNGEIWNLTTLYGDLDLTLIPSGTSGYEDLSRDCITHQLLGVIVRIASLADIIRSKQAANRPKDQRVLPTLRMILDRNTD